MHEYAANRTSPRADGLFEVAIAWGEMDALGHVNNAAYFRYMESARVAFLLRVGIDRLSTGSGVGVILQSVQARFRRPVVYPDTLRITSVVTDVQRDRFTLAHDMTSVALGEVACVGSGVIVAYDYASRRKADLPEDWVRRLRGAMAGGSLPG